MNKQISPNENVQWRTFKMYQGSDATKFTLLQADFTISSLREGLCNLTKTVGRCTVLLGFLLAIRLAVAT